jgi:hypothetical protein
VLQTVRMEPTGLDVEALYERYGPMVLRRCRFLLKEDQALDTTHDFRVGYDPSFGTTFGFGFAWGKGRRAP